MFFVVARSFKLVFILEVFTFEISNMALVCLTHSKQFVSPIVEYIVNAPPQHRNMTFELLHLHPGREYEVSIHAVTAAGPGPNVTARFKTKHKEHLGRTSPDIDGK